MVQGRFTAQFFNFLLLFIFTQAVCFDIVIDYCITSQENESRLLIMTKITTMYCDLNWLKWLDLKMTAKEIDIVAKSRYRCRVQARCNVAKSRSRFMECRLDVMLHRFLFSQAESPQGSKTQAHGSPLKCKMSNCSLAK